MYDKCMINMFSWYKLQFTYTVLINLSMCDLAFNICMYYQLNLRQRQHIG